MEFIQSERGILCMQDGYYYNKNRNLNGKLRYLTCAERTCKVRAKLIGDQVVVSTPHNHPPSLSHKEQIDFKTELKIAAIKNPDLKPRYIFEEVCKRFPNPPPFKKYRSLIYRYRAYGTWAGGGMVEDKTSEAIEEEYDEDVASRLDFSTLTSSMYRARQSKSTSEMEIQDIAGPSNFDNNPSCSYSTIQYETSEVMTSLHDPEFGMLEESGITSTPAPSTVEVEAVTEQEKKEEGNKESDKLTGTPDVETMSNTADNVLAEVSSAGGELEGNSNLSGDDTDPTSTPNTNLASKNKSVDETDLMETHSKATAMNSQSFLKKSFDESDPMETQLNSKEITCPSSQNKSLTEKNTPESQSNSTEKESPHSQSTLIPETNSKETQCKTTQTKGTKIKEKHLNMTEDDEILTFDTNMSKLQMAVNRLESVSKKMVAASLADQYEHFGKYISSLMKGLPTKKVSSLKKKLVSQVLDALFEEDKIPTRSIAIQANLDVLSETSSQKTPLETSTNCNLETSSVQCTSEQTSNQVISESTNRLGTSETTSKQGISEPISCVRIVKTNRQGFSEPANKLGISETISREGISEPTVRLGISEVINRQGISEPTRSDILETTSRPGISEIASGNRLRENDRGNINVPTDIVKLANNIPMFGGNFPVIIPGASSSSFQLLPVIPMSASPMMGGVSGMAGTQSMVNTFMTMSMPHAPPRDTIKTFAETAEGTLLAVTLPKPQIKELTGGTDNNSQKGTKRKKSTAYLIKKSFQPTPRPLKSKADNIRTDIPPISLANIRTQMGEALTNSPRSLLEYSQQQNTMTNSAAENPSSNFYIRVRSEENLQSEVISSDTGGGNESIFCRPMEKDPLEDDFKMDIEEGQELSDIKHDREYFDTLTRRDSPCETYIKEEAPDPGESSPNPASPGPTATTCSAATTTISTDNQPSQPVGRNIGCDPPDKEDSSGNGVLQP